MISCIPFISFAQSDTYYLFIGTYTRGTSEGIYIYRFNTTTGGFAEVSIAKGLTNPSFLSISKDKKYLYTLGGMRGDSVRALAIDPQTHLLKFINGQPLNGSSGAAHLEVDKTGKWVIVGNYGSGSISVLPVESNGGLGKVIQTIQLEGKSIVADRQDKPHVHSINIASNNKDVFVPDLGTDKIMTYALNDASGMLSPGAIPFTNANPGSGPRHFTFHPNGKLAYVVQELDATITAFRYTEGKLDSFQTIKMLPDDYTGRKWAADIHISPDGKFLYASNRGHESIALFSIDKKSGQLSFIEHQLVHGKTPRNFVIDPTGNFLLVANQESDNIVIFKRNKKTGQLTYIDNEIKVSQPVCLKFIR